VSDTAPQLLVLGIGNLLMGDEGIGVHVVRALERTPLPAHVACLDGGTGGFQLLGPMDEADRLILVDATLDGGSPGTVRRLRPRFSGDYPRTLTAHDIGLKDLLDAFHLFGAERDVTLFAVSIDADQEISTELSAPLAAQVPEIVREVLREIATAPRPSDVALPGSR
jgi:hydrogenase maturation protease